jgi:hypothetical protein
MNESEEMILCNLDRLRQLIKNVKADGQFTKAKRFEDYYDEVREREEEISLTSSAYSKK